MSHSGGRAGQTMVETYGEPTESCMDAFVSIASRRNESVNVSEEMKGRISSPVVGKARVGRFFLLRARRG